MNQDALYSDREQTLVKHLILRRYLEPFARIIGTWCSSLTYVDCFSGPWKTRSEDYEDTSFAIALKVLREARDELAQRKRDVRLRCFFIEKDRAAFAKLQSYVEQIPDVEFKTHNGDLEGAVSDIVRFVSASQGQTFPFIFIDPTGWTGYSLDVIRPLLELSPGEVLVNFMTEHIRRFVDSSEPKIRESFDRLFGDSTFRAALGGMAGLDRDDACARKYVDVVKAAGGYSFSSRAVVLNPQKDRSHFQLLYLTRNAKGIRVFKDAEKRSMKDMESARANAQQSSRIRRTRQGELFPADEAPPSAYFDELRDRYCLKAKSEVVDLLRSESAGCSYDALWAVSMAFPLVWESDLKEWIRVWVKEAKVEILGLAAPAKVPKLDCGHSIRCTPLF